MHKSKISSKTKCVHCLEEIKKADLSRKYAHELKNIFITISTVVNSEMENPHSYNALVSNNTSLIYESGECSPYIMERRKSKVNFNNLMNNTNTNINANNSNNPNESPFYFLKNLCDYGKTLIKEINDMGKDLINQDNNKVEPFNVSKAINFCVDMFETKKFYDKSKKNLEIYSDINFSYDKVVNSISETGFKMVLINLLTNSYKFTIKGHIVVRAVSIPKEKKIRILVKDSGKGFNPKDFKKNGCFYVYERNQELNADGSGLGLSIVNEILTKFNIKLDCISDSEKGGSLFYFDIEDSSPYYDEIIPQNLMTDSLNQIINDINTGKRNKSLFNGNKRINKNKNQNKEQKKNTKFKIKLQNVNHNKKEEKEESYIYHNYGTTNNNKSVSPYLKITNEKSNKNIKYNIYGVRNTNLFVPDKSEEQKRKSFQVFAMQNSNINNNVNITPNKKKINRFYSFENSEFKRNLNSFKKNGHASLLYQIIENTNIKKPGTFFNNRDEKENEKNNYIHNLRKKNKVNYKKILNKNFSKTKFYLFELRNLFLKSEIYINLYQKSFKRSKTELSSPVNKKNDHAKKSSHINNSNKIYIIICDDEEFVAISARELIIKYYIKKGKEPHVYFTPNGIECIYLMYKLYIIENKKIEYILLDMEMPYLNGIKTCNIIKSIKETNIPIYILSGDEPKDCIADGYCNKPLNEIDIINKLDKRK